MARGFLEQLRIVAREYPSEFEEVIQPFIKTIPPESKDMYTLKEICERLNIRYQTFYTRGLHNHPKILRLRKRYGKHYAYPPEAIETIKTLWEKR